MTFKKDDPVSSLKVKKSDGSIEKFNITKIEEAAKKSGCNTIEAKKIKDNISNWIYEKSKHVHMIGTDEIGKEVFICLSGINSEAATNFNEFKGFFGGKRRYRYHIPDGENKPGFFKRLFRRT